jgi:hypothetical protein
VLAQFLNPTVQQEALRSFNARPVTQAGAVAGEATGDDGAGQAMQGEGMQAQDSQPGAMLLRAKAGKGRRAGANGGFDAVAAQPATPLDTMAGLLLGSPEFQRR